MQSQTPGRIQLFLPFRISAIKSSQFGGKLLSTFRLLVALIMSACLALSILGGPVSAATRVATSSSVTVSSASVAPGQIVTVRGTIKKGARGYSGVRVALQQRAAGTASWGTLRFATTDRLGQIAATAKPIRNYEYRLVFSGNAVTYASSSSLRSVGVRQSVTISKTSFTSIDAGDTVTLWGTTSPALAGRVATLQVKGGTTWKSVSSSKVSAGRAFAVSAKSFGRGVQYYRVLVSGTTGVATAVSALRAFKIFAWYSLETVVPFSMDGLVPQANWRIAGRIYPKVLGAFQTQDSERTVTYGNLCRTFKASIGMMDLSYEGTEFFARTSKDGDSLGYMQPGQAPKSVSMNLTGSDFLEIGTYGGSRTSSAFPAFIGARISCTDAPGYFKL